MTELHDAAFRAGVWQYIAKRATELFNTTKEELKASLPQGDVVAGRSGDQILAKASWTEGRQSIVTEDPVALLAWVKANRPTEVVESVNPAFVASFKVVDRIVIDGQGEPVPGVGVKQGDPFISVRGTKDAPFLVATLLSSGKVTLDGVTPELEPAVVDGEVV